MDKLIERLKKHEGYSDLVYLDPLGFPTCGWGHHLRVGSRIPIEAAEAFFKQDVSDAIRDFNKLKKALGRETIKHLNEARARVIVEMIFNMGYPKVLQFKKMWEAIKQNDFKVAAAEMLNSRWATQVKRRAEVLAKIMQEGVDP